MRIRFALTALVLAGILAACDETTDPAGDATLAFGEETLGLGEARTATIVVRNTGSAAVGPVEVAAGPVFKAGIELPGVDVLATPDEIPTLNPGDSAVVELAITGANGLQAGRYTSELAARVQGDELASATIMFDVAVPANLVGAVEITQAPDALRQGDIVQFSAVVYDTLGQVIDATVTWTTSAGAGLFTANAEFLPYSSGDVLVVAMAGDKADTLVYDVAPRGVTGTFTVVGHGDVPSRFTSDVWVHGSAAITGTWGFRSEIGDMMYAWDISGATPVMTDSIQVAAFTVDDVMIRADGQLAVVTHEYMATPHAITLIDMSNPLHPTVAGEFLTDMGEPQWIGVHNAWLEGDYAYIVVDGVGPECGLWIIDISDPQNPVRVSRFWAGSSFLHDVIVRDGLAFLSHWDAGLVILDVGNGIRGGSPENPVEVSRIVTSGGEVHNAWYWPEAGYVFIGEEDFMTPGRLHVVDVSDLEQPVEVASFRMQGDTPHNYWLDEENEVLYTSWYSRGVQAVDVSGRLLGSLDLQGRMIAHLEYEGSDVNDCPAGVSGTSTCAWGPQLHDGYLYVADMNSGLWKLQLNIQ